MILQLPKLSILAALQNCRREIVLLKRTNLQIRKYIMPFNTVLVFLSTDRGPFDFHVNGVENVSTDFKVKEIPRKQVFL